MAIDKKTGQPIEPTAVTVTLNEAQAFQKALKKEYRTDHLTLPNIAPAQDKERDKVSDFERKIILGEDVTDETVVDNEGTTRKEWRERLGRGIMPKDAPKEALDSIGKHSIDVVDSEGQEKVVVTAPVSGQETVIAYPDLKEKGEVPFGSELIHSTSPVPETLDTTKTESAEPVKSASVTPSVENKENK